MVRYDNGIAIRTGKTISGKHYLIAIDFDGIDAVLCMVSVVGNKYLKLLNELELNGMKTNGGFICFF